MKRIFFLLFITQISIAAIAQNKYLYLQNSPENYKALGLIKDTIKSWEGGSRTAEDKNSSQCWYYDAHLDDGTNVVISFNLRDGGKLSKKITPYISVAVKLADGRKVGRTLRCDSKAFVSSREQCDVHIGKNYIKGDLKNYVIHIEDEAIKLDIDFERTIDSWRPETGHLNFGDSTSYCGWLVPVPEGKTNVTYTVFNKTTTSKGICYHDNTWWNKSPRKQINKWCWSSSAIGPYKIIAYEITAIKKYNKEQQLFFSIFKDGKVIADNPSKVSILKSLGIVQPIGKKPVSNILMYTYSDTSKTYELTLEKNNILLSSTPIKGKLMKAFVKFFTGFDGAYYRIRGNANLKVYQNNCVKESYRSDKSMWELFYFDNPY